MGSTYVMPLVLAGAQPRFVVTHWQLLRQMVSSQTSFNGMCDPGWSLTSPPLQCKVYQVDEGKKVESLRGKEAGCQHPNLLQQSANHITPHHSLGVSLESILHHPQVEPVFKQCCRPQHLILQHTLKRQVQLLLALHVFLLLLFQ